MQLADEEARRLNHEYIGTEHILLGLVKEGAGVDVLRNLGIDPARITLEVAKLVQVGPETVSGKLPQTPRAKRVIEYAIVEAHSFKHEYIGSEHILLGLLRESEGVSCQVLTNLGITLESAREEVRSLLGLVPTTTKMNDAICLSLSGDEFGARLRQLLLTLPSMKGKTIETIVVICSKQ